jgi:exodeoxyribonuclease VII small subunit
MSETPTDPQTFEELLSALEDRVRRLEKGDLPLETALDVFEQGIELTRSCHEKLDDADQRIQQLTRDPDPGA